MNEIPIHDERKPKPNLAKRIGNIIGATLAFAVTLLVLSGFVWLIVFVWRGILGS